MNLKRIKVSMVVSFVVVILLFLLFSSMVITGALANGGMMGSERMMSGISWMWIPTLLSLGLALLIGWAIFSRNVEKVLKS